MMDYPLREICQKIGVVYEGDDLPIHGLSTLCEAGEEDLSFFHNERYRKDLSSTKAAAVLIEERYAAELPSSTIPLITQEPYLKLAYASALFAHPLSVESSEPNLGEGCQIDPSVRFGKDVCIGEGTIVMAGCYLGDNCVVGANCTLYPNVTLYHDTHVGDRCILHAGSVLGSDGYGFAHTRDGEHVKIHQLGNVVVEEDVEIGANTTVDRGALGSTRIRCGSKIDNLVQIGHNCEIGEHVLIVAQSGISGSSRLGRNVIMGGQSATAGHLSIGDFATIAARGAVTKSLEGGKVYGGVPAVDLRLWKRMQAVLMRLAKRGR